MIKTSLALVGIKHLSYHISCISVVSLLQALCNCPTVTVNSASFSIVSLGGFTLYYSSFRSDYYMSFKSLVLCVSIYRMRRVSRRVDPAGVLMSGISHQRGPRWNPGTVAVFKLSVMVYFPLSQWCNEYANQMRKVIKTEFFHQSECYCGHSLGIMNLLVGTMVHPKAFCKSFDYNYHNYEVKFLVYPTHSQYKMH